MADNKAYLHTDAIDRVVWNGSKTIIANNSTINVSTGIGEYALPIGIFSTDGGATWSDCEGFFFAESGLRGDHIAVRIEVFTDGDVHLTAQAYGAASSSTSCLVKFVLLALDTPTQPVYTFPSGTSPTAYVVSDTQTYRQIVKSDVITGFDSGGLRTIAHGQSDIPMASHWARGYVNDNIVPFSTFVVVNGGVMTGYHARYDATNLYALSGAGAFNTYYYRIYKES